MYQSVTNNSVCSHSLYCFLLAICGYVLSAQLFPTLCHPMDLWTIALQAPLPMEFSRQEYWNEVPFPTEGDLPNPGIKPASLVSPALAGKFFTTLPPGKFSAV